MVPRIPNTLCHPLAARRVTERIQPDKHTPLGRMPWPCGSTQADCVLCSSSALGSAIVQCRAHWYRIPRERIRPFRSVRACWRPCHHQSCGWGKPRPMRSAHTPRVARCPRGPIGRLHRLAQLATGRWRGRGPQGPSRPFGKPPCPQPHRTSSGCGWDKREPASWPSWRPSARSEPIRPLRPEGGVP